MNTCKLSGYEYDDTGTIDMMILCGPAKRRGTGKDFSLQADI